MKPTINLSGLIYFLQIILFGCGELQVLEINVQNQVKVSINFHENKKSEKE